MESQPQASSPINENHNQQNFNLSQKPRWAQLLSKYTEEVRANNLNSNSINGVNSVTHVNNGNGVNTTNSAKVDEHDATATATAISSSGSLALLSSFFFFLDID